MELRVRGMQGQRDLVWIFSPARYSIPTGREVSAGIDPGMGVTAATKCVSVGADGEHANGSRLLPLAFTVSGKRMVATPKR